MSIFVQAAPSAVAAAIKATGVWVAWGTGLSSWDANPQPEPVGATALVAETGRRRAQVIEFVRPDANGSIVLPQGKFSISATPTDTLYVRCNFANTDAVGQQIREAAAFIGAKLVAGLPVGQDYYLPQNVADGGVMLMLDRFGKIERSSEFSASVAFIMTL